MKQYIIAKKINDDALNSLKEILPTLFIISLLNGTIFSPKEWYVAIILHWRDQLNETLPEDVIEVLQKENLYEKPSPSEKRIEIVNDHAIINDNCIVKLSELDKVAEWYSYEIKSEMSIGMSLN